MSEEEPLIIEVRHPRWRLGAIAGLAYMVAWCVLWRREGARDDSVGSFLFVGGGLVMGVGTIAWALDFMFTSWRLRIDSQSASLQRWSLIRRRGWSCPRSEFAVGEVTVVEGRSIPLFGERRFICLHLSGEEVRFMGGHRQAEMEAVRVK